MAVKTLTFANCWVHVDCEALFLQTVFRDGARVVAVLDLPHDFATAERVGYGAGIGAATTLWREHDPLHTFLAEKQGLPYSPTLWAVAHPDDPNGIPAWAQSREEEFVLNFQQFLNRGTLNPDMDWLSSCGHDLNWLRHEARALLEQLRL